MYERSYGYRYEEVRDMTTVEIAKAIRADIKQAKAEGLLPTRWTYSVRTDHGTSIDVEVRDCPDAWEPCEGIVPGSKTTYPDGGWTASPCPRHDCPEKPHDVLTEEARVAKMTLERIHGAYNYDGSEIQLDYFDVHYYGHVEFEDAWSYDFRMREKARLEDQKAAREAGKVVGKVTNYKRDGSTVTHLLIEIPTPDGAKPTRKALACGARSWRGSMIGKAADDAEVTCSRCAKKV